MPKVSVIIPSYNHARFLEKRILSVLNQTFQDFEIIFLDDASTDNSREVFRQFRSDPRIRAILNETNSGSVFKQWNRGFKEATGEYVWIAESDDYADNRFLEVLVHRLDEHPSAGIAYCQSWAVDENEEARGIVELERKRLGSSRWEQDFVNSGQDECARYFSRGCMINNASSALVRRGVVERVGYADECWRIAGDWVFWVKMLLASDIVYVAQPLNYWRQHSGTVRSSTTRTGQMTIESYEVSAYISARVDIPRDILELARAARFHDWVYYSAEYLFGLGLNLRILRCARQFDPHITGRVLRFLPLAPARAVGWRVLRYLRGLRNARGKRLAR